MLLFWPLKILSIEALILLCTIIFLGRYWLHKQWQQLEQLNIPHDPPSLFRLGNALDFISDKLKFEVEQKAKHGPVWGFYFFHLPRIAVHDPEIIKQIFIREFSSFPCRVKNMPLRFNGKYTGKSVLSSYGEQWKRGRLTLAPTFSISKLRSMASLVVVCTDNTIEEFKKKVESKDGRISTKDVFMRLSLDVICSTAFSMDVNSQDDSATEPDVSKYARMFATESFFRIPNLISMVFPIFSKFLSRLNEYRRHINYLNELCRVMVERREQDSSQEIQRIDLMQLMIGAKIPDLEIKSDVLKGLTSSEIIGNALTMLIAGYETTGTSMTCLAYNLAMHPEIQMKLQAEIDEMYTENGESIDYVVVSSLKYLDMCVNENLRLYNPIPSTLRTAEHDVTIYGLTIPKKWVIVFPIHELCHNPEY